MKNKLWLILAVTLLMTACVDMTSGAKEETEQNNDHEKTEETEKDTVETSKNKSENNANEEKQIEEKQGNKKKTAEPVYKIDEETSSVVPVNEQGNEKIVLLTIDDAPDTYAIEMAKTLKDLDAGAIFFVNGHFLDTPEGEEKLKKIHNMGFEIGNHTYNHAYLPDVSTGKQEKEIVSLNDKIEGIIGERPQFFRAPNGANTDFTKQVAKDEGMVTMNWTYGYDYFEPYMDAEKLTEAMVTGKGPEVDVSHSLLNPGANLLMHDREWTAKALEDIVTGLRDKGYEIADPALLKTIE
ncbi:MAG TPA: polysaccharide deacetylase family protein [Lentibacillus sp.]|uniref:polysaccharide deacetylase family protein n=1 Tax=Lentibacillus sp. TaxID=1925746 RepID=UPI002B4B6F18|nr:polysaccharide deacetylase family protein [Lentibacillus sp.]HLR62261.1 polysaccharide deacetylase family protein [Lentibacillus sp.]